MIAKLTSSPFSLSIILGCWLVALALSTKSPVPSSSAKLPLIVPSQPLRQLGQHAPYSDTVWRGPDAKRPLMVPSQPLRGRLVVRQSISGEPNLGSY